METAADILVSITGVAVVGIYTWSLRGHFVSETMPLGAKLISGVVLLSTLVFLVLTWTLVQPLLAQAIGIAIMAAAVVLFFSAIAASRRARLRYAFDPEKPGSLVTTGPYGYVRHPFYVSYIIFWVGWALAVWSPWAVLNVVILIALYVVAARTEEKNFAGSPLAGDYDAYRKRVGFFFPRLG